VAHCANQHVRNRPIEPGRAQALQHASGAHRRRLEAWRGEMLACLAHTEAVIDFGEEEGLAAGVLDGVRPRVAALLGDLARHLRAGVHPHLQAVYCADGRSLGCCDSKA